MVKRLVVGAALCLMGVGCGGGGNAAEGKKFTYGAPTAATGNESGVLDGQVSLAASQKTTLSADAQSVGNTQAVTGSLLDSTGFGARMVQSPRLAQRLKVVEGRYLQRPNISMAATSGGFDNAGGVTVSATSVNFSNCGATQTPTNTDPSGTTTETTKVSVNGHVNKTGDKLDWDLTEAVDLSETSPQGNSTLSVKGHQSGSMTLTATTLKANELSSLTLSINAQGQSASAGVDEAVDIDVVFDAGPPSCITSGTVEAKRVWTQRPSGATSTQLPDEAAKVTWTGCGTATIAVAHN